ncbi:ribokinase [Lachnospiraceae bacterium 62-35]
MKVLNFGSLNIDNVYSVEHFVRGGETLSSEKMEVFSGGKGLNQSIALSKALEGSGIPVYHAGAIGKSDGEFLLKQMEDAGVCVELTECLDCKTGHAIIQRDKEGQNCILLYGGANQAITREMVDRAMDSFEEGDFLILQNEISQIGHIMEKAHEKGMKIVLNPSPMNEKILGYPLEHVDYFLLNEIEAADICGMEGDGEKTKEELLTALSERFPGAKILLTLGGDGSMYKDGDLVLEQGIYKVPVVDTTAAGDTFTGYFIGGLVRGETAKEALDHGAKAASIAVSRPGAAPSIPCRREI